MSNGNGKYFQNLSWDTAFFGVPVARISTDNLDMKALQATLDELKQQGVKLVYWFSRCEHDLSEITRLGAEYLGGRVIYRSDLNNVFAPFFPAVPVEICPENTPVAELAGLALQSGRLSRYALDSRISDDKFSELYHLWIQRSISREIANEVMVVRYNGHAAGMVTLAREGECGHIGLIAVDERYRGRGYGLQLVAAAHKWFIEQGCAEEVVVTQSQNIPARCLYEKCGYKVDRIEHTYHFWL